jgi:hypothetical protein
MTSEILIARSGVKTVEIHLELCNREIVTEAEHKLTFTFLQDRPPATVYWDTPTLRQELPSWASVNRIQVRGPEFSVDPPWSRYPHVNEEEEAALYKVRKEDYDRSLQFVNSIGDHMIKRYRYAERVALHAVWNDIGLKKFLDRLLPDGVVRAVERFFYANSNINTAHMYLYHYELERDDYDHDLYQEERVWNVDRAVDITRASLWERTWYGDQSREWLWWRNFH